MRARLVGFVINRRALGSWEILRYRDNALENKPCCHICALDGECTGMVLAPTLLKRTFDGTRGILEPVCGGKCPFTGPVIRMFAASSE